MPFGLSNAGSSFCHLMEQCLRNQQFVSLMLYLDNICIFTPSIEVMLDQIELVFNRLKEFHHKIKPKKCHFSDTSVLFLGHILSSGGIFANPEEVEKVQDWPIPTNAKEVHSFLGLASYYQRFIPGLANPHKCKGSTFLPRTCFLLSEVHTKICPDCLMFTQVGWSNFNQDQEN